MKFSSLHFLADENIHPGFIIWLRQEEYDVNSVTELGLRGRSDEEILSYAEGQNMVVLTHDSDFGRIIFTTHDLKTGIVYLRPGHISGSFHNVTIEALAKTELDFTFPFMLVAEKHSDNIKIRLRKL
jgi:predicted nuclease of predicted toxin-antitoxin system